ncbi:hypothetical protein FQZ97_1058730 [compost metagenome]
MAVRLCHEGVAEAGHIHPHQLEPGRHIKGLESFPAAGKVIHDHVCHFIARCHQAVNHIVYTGAFSYGKDAGIGGLQVFIDHNTAS